MDENGIDAASRGDILEIRKGTYAECVVIPSGKKGLQLRGRNKPTIQGGDACAGPVITVLSDDVIIQGIKIRNGLGDGIRFEKVTGGIVYDVDIEGPDGDCVDFRRGKNHLVEDSTLRSCGQDGVRATSANDVAVRGTEIRSAGGDLRHSRSGAPE